MTPWVPIAVPILIAAGIGWLVARRTRNAAYGVGGGLVVIAVALLLFAQIATVAYVPAGLLVVFAVIAIALGSTGRRAG